MLRVCSSTSVKLAADTSVPAGETPGLMIAMDHGARGGQLRHRRGAPDILLTPDFRILIGGPGAADVKIRLGQHGDTCVDNAGVPSDVPTLKGTPAPTSSLGWNAGTDAPYVLVSSVFEGGAYRVQPGQRVMFEHGSLHEVVDNEKEPCGCPPDAHPGTNEFPLAQSAGLAPLAKPAPNPNALGQNNAPPQVVEPLVYKSPEQALPSPLHRLRRRQKMHPQARQQERLQLRRRPDFSEVLESSSVASLGRSESSADL